MAPGTRLKPVLGAAAAALVAVCGAGCAAPLAADESAPAPSASLPAAPATASEQLDDGSTAPPPVVSTLRADHVSQESARATAVEAMALFARRSVSADAWWVELSPLLSALAAQDYRYTDPANVPFTTITGTARALPSQTARIGRVSVPTDAGVYLVVLSRTDAAPPWVVERFVPPEGEGD